MDPRSERIEQGLPLIEAILDQWGYVGKGSALRADKKSQVMFWLENFQPSEIEPALRLLSKVQYRDDQTIRNAVSNLSLELERILGGNFEGARLFPLGLSPSSSGGLFLYDFRKFLNLDELHFPATPFADVDSDVETLVFFDDIVGSGNQAVSFFDRHLRSLDRKCIYVTVFAYKAGLARVREKAGFAHVLAGFELSDEERAFSDSSLVFNDASDRDRIKSLCEQYGAVLYPSDPLGYDDTQSLLVFPHNTPNNTLPIIWAGPQNEKALGVLWNPLWARRRKVRHLAVQAFNATAHLANVRAAFSRWRNRYIHMTGKERLKEVPLYAYEIESGDKPAESSQSSGGSARELRHGTIRHLRDTVAERRLLLMGEAGMGKTTTLQFLAQEDANEVAGRIPIYLALNTLTGETTLERRIFDELGGPAAGAEALLISGGAVVYLDGLNEVMSSIRQRVMREIGNFLRKYSALTVVLTTRPQAYQDDLKGVPCFMLQGLSATQVEEFVERNSSSGDVASIVLEALRTRRALRRLVARPLFLLMLLNVVERTGDVPETQALIIRAFLRGLLQRERERNAEFVPDEFYVLMQGFAFEGHRRNGGNAAMPLAEAVMVLGTRRADLGLTANLVATLHHAVELGLLLEDDGRYNFVHQVFQDYFVAEELAARREAK